jgi:hypothetical protein
MDKKFFTLISDKRFHNLVFFCVIIGFSISIHSASSDYNCFMSIEGQIGSITPIVVLAFLPYWMIKLFYGLYLKTTKGEFSWINNKLLYLIPLIIWIAVMYIIYAPEYALKNQYLFH